MWGASRTALSCVIALCVAMSIKQPGNQCDQTMTGSSGPGYAPATRALPPMVDWPQRLKQAIGNHTYMCHGGHEFDGRLISELDTQELREVAEDIGKKGIRSIAISSVFSPVNAEMELEAARFFEQQLPGVMVSVSH